MNISIVHDVPENIWRSFVDNNPQGNIFHTPEMFKVFSKTKKYVPQLWAAVDEQGDPLAMFFPVQISIFDGWLRQLTTRAVSFGSILWSPTEAGVQAMDLVLKEYTSKSKLAPLYSELRNLTDLEQMQPTLQKNGFVYEEHLNYLIDISSPEVILNNLRPRTRQNIRHVLNKGDVAIEELDQREKIGAWYSVLKQTYQAAQVPLADPSLFEAAFDILNPKGMVRFTQARAANTLIATSVELLYKDSVFGWYGGVDRAYNVYRANEFLTWNILDWSARQGFRLYDFGGAGKPNEEYGVRDFKSKFGGKLVCFGRNTYVHRPKLLAISEKGYQALRRWL